MAELDPLFGIHAQALSVQRQRMEVLASNLANADTPHYQARDIDFAKVLASTQENTGSTLALAATSAQHVQGSSSTSLTSPLSFRVPLQPSVDGNTVDEQVEQAAFADAALHYQASLSFLNGEVKGLITAITGQ
ncbi:flagellar basal body rod protein FlgB [Nevskia soli]|uniref:flagellar basal body rod protein FlgB n=1 Tax=Nevskia soli TaxID=418856 RepID=UPI0004A734F9|nr:flagellar basal body rod protein FlgB [Nevskia soli]